MYTDVCGAKDESIVRRQAHVGDTSRAFGVGEREQEFAAAQVIDVNITVSAGHDTAHAVSRHRHCLHLTGNASQKT